MDGIPPGTGIMTDHEDDMPVSLPPDALVGECPALRSAGTEADGGGTSDGLPTESVLAEPADGDQPQAECEAAEPDERPVERASPDAELAVPPESPPEILPHRVVEAILFSSDSPLPPQKIAQVMGVGTARDVRKHIETLNQEYAEGRLAFRVEEIAGGFQMLTLPVYNAWLTKLLRTRQEAKLSQAALETLAIVAYKQPCTRADIEAIRGVAAGDLLQRLREMNLVKIVGRAEDLGRPLLYGTTKRFLEVFGLPSLDDLPQVEALAGGTPTAAPRIAEQAPSTAEEEPPTGLPAAVTEPALDGAGIAQDSTVGPAAAVPSFEEPAAVSGGTGVSPVDAPSAQTAPPPGELPRAVAAPTAVLDPAQLADAYAAAESNAAAARDAEGEEPQADNPPPHLTIAREPDEPDGDDDAAS